MDPFTIAVIVGALALGAYQGSEQQSAQRKALRNQQGAQQQAEVAALSQQRKSDMAEKAANRQTPDIGSMLAFEQSRPSFGASSRTGAGDADPSRVKLGRTSLLGSP
jgi:Tfp pilus assembly major pilin PilA